MAHLEKELVLVKQLGKQFKALMLVAEALEDVASLDEPRREADKNTRRAVKELEDATASLDRARKELSGMKEDSKRHRKQMDKDWRAATEKSAELVEDAQSKADTLVAEAKREATFVLSVLDEKKAGLVAANNILTVENKALQATYVRLRKEMDALKARF